MEMLLVYFFSKIPLPVLRVCYAPMMLLLACDEGIVKRNHRSAPLQKTTSKAVLSYNKKGRHSWRPVVKIPHTQRF